MNRVLVLAALLATLTACQGAPAVAPDAPATPDTGAAADLADDGLADDTVDPGDLNDAEEGYLAALTVSTCGDGSCDAPEDCNSCAQDCGSCCGNNKCEPPEDCNSCSSDCGPCQ